jgi:hypothetical protein
MDYMEVLTPLALIGVLMIPAILWMMVREQLRHDHAIEITLAIIKEKMLGRLETVDPSKPGGVADVQG